MKKAALIAYLMIGYFAFAQESRTLTLEQPTQQNFQGTLTPAQSVGADLLWPGGSTGYNLSGKGLYCGVWEAFVGGTSSQVNPTSDLTGRVTIIDSNKVSSHATNVALIIASSGINKDKGVAFQAHILSYDINNRFNELKNEAHGGSLHNILVSNHSYAIAAGWYGGHPNWYGVKEISTTEDHKFGRYGSSAEGLFDTDYDEVANNSSYLSIVKAASNERGSSGSIPYSRWSYNNGNWATDTGLTSPVPEIDGGTDGYDCIPSGAMGKNIITVGACNSLSSFPPAPSDIIVSTKSGWGPADDGRIKPDLVAPGSLTSYSTPVVSGTILLLQEAYDSLQGQYMNAATVKGLLCHTASEAGPHPGPDYQHGWGMVNAFEGAQLIHQLGKGHFIEESTLQNNQSNTYQYYVNSDTTEVKVTLSWTDIEGTPVTLTYTPSDLNNRTPMLVNDLDVKLIRSSDQLSYYPYTLDPLNPANAAVKKDNKVDNLEIIGEDHLDRGWYTVMVSHKDSLAGGLPQSYSLIVSGMDDSPSTVGLSETELDPFLMYPNPAGNWLQIEGNLEIEKIQIFTIEGKPVFQKSVSEKHCRIQTSQLADGMYIVSIQSEGSVYNKPLIIQ